MNIEIKNIFGGEIISGKYESVKDALEKNRGANLEGAYLKGANLVGADLKGANLRGAKGVTLPVISISGSRHSVYYHDGTITIGCESHTAAEWIKNYKSIGEANEYTAEQIAEYKQYINICAKFAGKKNRKVKK